ncbi:16S rRNA (cytidine(1402)-2'-O)-methyltransferase [candidate division WWE3 bacterium CG10_big_fil_rev_8_21_14_0_10_32_10]|uniref:Ribosomal RNA small subunit methyltransferase I n=1 Tax=candidate division WWE3 bacterium CG10_big_fil_rev_8_21_14_0_10_32_10 TaxID=1975090 RepID=A0A2H0RAS7_UNCKA|nr:MAG: 16S rRNA (cytidine(1402)-2'-O)-methyltransferase [candidate division WWE3 bacterium CG10_big_fil_rev_8_21_14_0_10_32_10]
MNTLYVVATPIGNIKDITIRAIEVLKKADAIITENQNTTRKLFNLLKIDITNKRLITFADFNNVKDLKKTLNLIENSDNAILISEAGTPLISDPGYKIISKIRDSNLDINIVSIPGASSILAHLSISGLPTDCFMFIGFLPKKELKKEQIIKGFHNINKIHKTTFIILESKYRLLKTLNRISKIYPSSLISVGNDLTKMYEHVFYGKILEVLEKLNKLKIKGEFIIHLKI